MFHFFWHVDMQILNASLHEYSLFDNTNQIFNNTSNRILKYTITQLHLNYNGLLLKLWETAIFMSDLETTIAELISIHSF